MPGGRSDEPFDLGALRLKTRTVPAAGTPAPDFEVKTVDGKAISLRDYRGKHLLLDFGVTWDVQSRFQVARLNDVQKKFGDDDRFAILSLVMAPDDAKTRTFIAEKEEPWPQAIIGPLTNPIASKYGIEANYYGSGVPAAVLIGPDGRIVPGDVQYYKISDAVGQALGRPARSAPPHASISRITRPWTSVRRRSMPLWRKVSRVWSMPSSCSAVAWRS